MENKVTKIKIKELIKESPVQINGLWVCSSVMFGQSGKTFVCSVGENFVRFFDRPKDRIDYIWRQVNDS